MIEYLTQVDTNFFLFLNGINSPFWDTVMWYLSGKLTWVPLYLIIIYFIFRKHRFETLWILIAIALVVTATDQLSVHLFKNVFERLRPCHNPDLSGMVHLVNGKCGGKFGFVSSHAANTFGVALFLLNVFKIKWFSISILLWATIVSYSRIYLGVHFPGDVIVGATLGAIVGWAIWKLLDYISCRYNLLTYPNKSKVFNPNYSDNTKH